LEAKSCKPGLAPGFFVGGQPGAIPGKVCAVKYGAFAVTLRPELRQNKEIERFAVSVKR